MMESFNFANMMKETDQTVEEMLTELQKDIATFKMTGECSPKLDAFLRVHGHAKKQLADEAKAVPNYEVPAVQRKAAGEPALSLGDVQSHDANRSMHPGMTKLDAPKPAHHHIHDELDELAELAGIGKVHEMHEGTCNECGMYESSCECDHMDEGNPLTKGLADPSIKVGEKIPGTDTVKTKQLKEKDIEEGNPITRDLADPSIKVGDTMPSTGKPKEKQLKETECPSCHCDPCKCPKESTTLEDIAKLAGIAVEGRDYGDTTYPNAPTYDNTPDEEVQGEDVLLKGGDGEVAGAEKKMAKDGAARFSDNPLAMKESETTAADLMKEAATFDPIEAMGRKLMKQYESIKLQK